MQDISRAFAMCSFAVSLNQHTPISSPRGLRDLRKRVGLSRFSLNQSVSSFSQTSSWLERTQGARSHAAAWNMPKDTFDAGSIVETANRRYIEVHHNSVPRISRRPS